MDEVKRFIFLDVDGVLNCETTTDTVMECYVGIDDRLVANLKAIVDATKATIILTSTWKTYWEKEDKYKQDESANHLDEKLLEAGLVIEDKTIETYMERGKSIALYLHNFRKANPKTPIRYVVLDDEEFDYKRRRIMSHFVQTSFERGLTKAKAQRAIKILK